MGLNISRTAAFVATCSFLLTACSDGKRSDAKSSKPVSDVATTVAKIENSIPASETCENPISLELAEDEKEIDLFKQVVDGTDATYILVGTKSFVAAESGGVKKFLSGAGDGFEGLPVPEQTVENKDLAKVVCHTSRPVEKQTNSMNGSLEVPLAYSTKDGSISFYRRDAFSAKDGVTSTKTTIYPRVEKLKADNGPVPQGLIVKTVLRENGEIVLRLQITNEENGTTIVNTIEATYTRK